ncbi:hypothetical protein BJV78DRAFT_415888 [Lactifluus subvellereus]|nr:hypothetical protein BJV78DRAFT_415888 [Lactifluus subvellereus]
MAPADAGTFRRPPFSTEAGASTALRTAISSENLVTDCRSIAPLNTSLTPPRAQNTPSPWSFPSQPSPSSLSSPSYQHTPSLVGQSNHPSPDTGPAQSQSPPSSMIGPTPTYYDPDKDSQPQSQDYSHWIGHYNQVFPDTQLYPQPSAVDPATERPMQPPQHMDRYQFVNSQPSSDTSFPFFTQNRFDGRPGPSRSQHNPSLSTHTQGWPQTQGPTSDHPYIPVAGSLVHPTFTDTLPVAIPPFTFSAETLHGGSVLSPPSEATLTSAPRSPAVSDQHTGTGTSTTPTAVTVGTSPRHPSNRNRNTKRRKADTDSDDDEDTADANIGANLPRPNRL